MTEYYISGTRPNLDRISNFSLRQRGELGANLIFYLISCLGLLSETTCGIAFDMTSDTSRGALGAVQVDMDKLAQSIQVLPEKTLREIAKGPLVKFTLSCDDIE